MDWRIRSGGRSQVLRVLGVVSLFLSSACSEKTPQFDLPAEVDTALRAAGDFERTKHFVTATGSIADLRDKLVEGFPQIQALIDGEGQTSEALIHELSGTPDPGLDQKLMFVAYALENRGETDHLPVLRTFLTDNLQSALYRTRHMVARAIEVLETGSATGTGFYDGMQMAKLMETPGTSTSALTQGRSVAAARNSITCIKRYLLKVDGKPVSWIQGQVYSSDPMKGNSALEAEGKECQATVALHGGTYVDDEAPAYPGKPTRTFNCAGYGLKGFNKQEGALIPWTVDPEHARKNLIDTGLLVEITDDSEALPSDLVFYFGHSGRAGHVAVINSITGAGPLRSIIVRNGDGPSGLWEDEIDSTYYFDKWYDASSRHKFKERRIYRWKDGPPIAEPDPASKRAKGHCDYEPPSPDDPDEDGHLNADDNCPDTANEHQIDSDDDGIGNECDDTPCPTYDFVTGSCGAALDGCIEGFYCSRETIACEQETCPEGSGRTYTLECCCNCWADKTRQNLYDPCRAGFLLKCLPAAP